MKRFAFALERILEYRKQLELDRRRTFAKAAEVFRQREDQLRALAGELAEYRTRLAEMGTGRISIRQLALYRSYMTHVELQLDQAVVWLRDAGRDMETRRKSQRAQARRLRVRGEPAGNKGT
jgi:flagellar export protein FliJ